VIVTFNTSALANPLRDADAGHFAPSLALEISVGRPFEVALNCYAHG